MCLRCFSLLARYISFTLILLLTSMLFLLSPLSLSTSTIFFASFPLDWEQCFLATLVRSSLKVAHKVCWFFSIFCCVFAHSPIFVCLWLVASLCSLFWSLDLCSLAQRFVHPSPFPYVWGLTLVHILLRPSSGLLDCLSYLPVEG